MKKTLRSPIIISVAFTLLILLITWSVCPVGFETNDDTGILTLVMGGRTGTPTADTIFCNVIWGAFLAFLYKVFPSVPWYIIVYKVLMCSVQAIVCYYCFRLFCRKPFQSDEQTPAVRNIVLSCVVFLALYLSIFCYPSVLFQFTVMAGISGMGAILLMQLFPNGNIGVYIGYFILVLIADTIRPKVGYLLTVALIYEFVVMWIMNKKAKIIYPIISTAIQAVVFSVNYVYEKVNGWAAFRRYHTARSNWTDYPKATFEKAREAYESVGWDESLLMLGRNWFFMDRRYNTEVFEKLSITNDIARQENPLHIRMLNSLLSLYKSLIDIKLFFVLVVIIILWIIISYKKDKVKLLAILSSIALAGSILFYFTFLGRMNFRVALAVVFIFIIPPVFLVVESIFQSSAKPIYLGRIVDVSVGIIIFSIVASNGLGREIYKLSNTESRRNGMEIKRNVENYAMCNEGKLFIYDNTLSFAGDPYTVYPDKKPYNLTFWGGSGMYSPPYYTQLKANGYDELYSDRFFDKNIMFIGNKAPSKYLCEYMSKQYPGSKVKIVETHWLPTVKDGFVVYRFDMPSNKTGEDQKK